jgi:hypothetical protein
MRVPWRPRRNLAERLGPYLQQHRVLSEPLVDVDPIRMFLFRWMIETGDPVAVIAKGFDIDVALTRQLLDGSVRRLPRQRSVELKAALGLGSGDRLIGDDHGALINLPECR